MSHYRNRLFAWCKKNSQWKCVPQILPSNGFRKSNVYSSQHIPLEWHQLPLTHWDRTNSKFSRLYLFRAFLMQLAIRCVVVCDNRFAARFISICSIFQIINATSSHDLVLCCFCWKKNANKHTNKQNSDTMELYIFQIANSEPITNRVYVNTICFCLYFDAHHHLVLISWASATKFNLLTLSSHFFAVV